ERPELARAVRPRLRGRERPHHHRGVGGGALGEPAREAGLPRDGIVATRRNGVRRTTMSSTDRELIDTCATGGDASGIVNVSTVGALGSAIPGQYRNDGGIRLLRPHVLPSRRRQDRRTG